MLWSVFKSYLVILELNIINTLDIYFRYLDVSVSKKIYIFRCLFGFGFMVLEIQWFGFGFVFFYVRG